MERSDKRRRREDDDEDNKRSGRRKVADHDSCLSLNVRSTPSHTLTHTNTTTRVRGGVEKRENARQTQTGFQVAFAQQSPDCHHHHRMRCVRRAEEEEGKCEGSKRKSGMSCSLPGNKGSNKCSLVSLHCALVRRATPHTLSLQGHNSLVSRRHSHDHKSRHSHTGSGKPFLMSCLSSLPHSAPFRLKWKHPFIPANSFSLVSGDHHCLTHLVPLYEQERSHA